MITAIADNIISPLGFTSDENFRAVLDGKTALRLHEGLFGLPEPACVSLTDREKVTERFVQICSESDEYTYFEKLCILSASTAIAESGMEAGSDDTLFVLSTTKGNVELLTENGAIDPRCYPAESAKKIAGFFGNMNVPTVVSNACVSGVCAQIAAARALMSGRYKNAVITGCDVLSKFIISGFQSFKALSQEPCRPYDRERTGLNLGEAAGTIILTAGNDNDTGWEYAASSNHNDANHISGPSRTGEGCYRVLKDILKDVDAGEIAFVNAHGTATAYNDEMESIALNRAGLSYAPVNGLKGYFGHTLGAAGVIETILSMKAADNGVIIPTKGFKEQGTTNPVNVSAEMRKTDRRAFIKILSGFGGSNAGIAYRKGGSR